jgi:uncharacterized protein (DUF1810 family)
VNAVPGASAEAIFGYPDFLKFRSCMTLFALAAGERNAAAAAAGVGVFSAALERYYAGEDDPQTLRLLSVL